MYRNKTNKNSTFVAYIQIIITIHHRRLSSGCHSTPRTISFTKHFPLVGNIQWENIDIVDSNPTYYSSKCGACCLCQVDVCMFIQHTRYKKNEAHSPIYLPHWCASMRVPSSRCSTVSKTQKTTTKLTSCMVFIARKQRDECSPAQINHKSALVGFAV